MYAIFVTINVKPKHVDAFTQASLIEAQGVVRNEPGCFQFHMLKDPSNPNRFYFFEIFRDEAAAQAHRETEIFKTWRQTVHDMMDGPPERIATMQTAFPSDDGLERQKPGLLNW
jgi:autoinducer 2-degrading protein